MHVHAKDDVRYLVTTRGDATWEAGDLEEAFETLRAIHGEGLWRAIETRDWDGRAVVPLSRVETVDGAGVPEGELTRIARARTEAWLATVNRRRGRFEFRREPVPGVRRRGNGGWVRTPRHKAEHAGREANRDALREEGLAEPRGRGLAGLPPTAFDDVGRRVERGWKAQRATRWKAPRD